MQMVLISLFSLIIGGVLLLYGFRVLRAVLPVWGFLAGFWLGADLAALALGQGFLGTIAGWAAGLILGAVGAALAHFFHHLSIGLVGAVIGYHLGFRSAFNDWPGRDPRCPGWTGTGHPRSQPVFRYRIPAFLVHVDVVNCWR